MANIHSLNIGGSTYVIEPNLINITAKTSGMSYVAFFSDRRAGGRYAYSYYGAFLNNTTGELQIPHLRLKHTNGNYGSYLSFGDSNYSYIFENPDDKLNIFSSKGTFIIGGPTYISSNYTYVANDMYFYKNILPVNDSYSNIGTPEKRFSNIYVDNINTDNINAAIYVTYNPLSNNSYSVPFMDYGHSKHSKIYSDNTFNYNPYTNTLYATNFAGTARNATNALYSDQVAIHTKEFIKDGGLCSLDAIYDVPVILGGCDCTIFSDQPDYDFFGLMTDYHPQNNNSNWLRYNFNDQTLKSTNFEGNLEGNATTATTATNANNVKVTVTSTSANYPLILGPSTTVGATVTSGNKSLYTDSANNLYYNPNTNTLTTTTFSGSLSGNASSATNATYINVTSCSTNNGTYRLLFTNGTGNRKAYTNSGVCVNPYSKTIIADQICGFGNGAWNSDWTKATAYNGSISSGSSWAPVCAVRTTGGVWSMGHIWPGDPQNYLTFSYVGDSVREKNGNVTLKLPVPKYNRTNFIPIGDQQFDGKPAVARIVTLSSSEYNNLTSKDPNTLYLII